ncbi:MaoC family dehydratase [Halogranum amylolyticum]
MASRTPDASMDATRATSVDEQSAGGRDPGVAYDDEEWTATRTVERRENLAVGDSVVFEKSFSEDDIDTFARTSGDTNRLHLDGEFAGETRFGGRIAHGTLVSGLVSAALARLPGLTVYLSQDTSFNAPATMGGRFTAECEIVEELGDWQYRLTTVVTDEAGTELIDGEAVVLVDELPETSAASTADESPSLENGSTEPKGE